MLHVIWRDDRSTGFSAKTAHDGIYKGVLSCYTKQAHIYGTTSKLSTDGRWHLTH